MGDTARSSFVRAIAIDYNTPVIVCRRVYNVPYVSSVSSGRNNELKPGECVHGAEIPTPQMRLLELVVRITADMF